MVHGAEELSVSDPADAARLRPGGRQFLGMEQTGDDLHWRLTVVPELATPMDFLFGGCGLGAALVALEAASGRRTVWSTAQYLSFAPVGAVLDLSVTLAAVGRRVTQARAVGYVGGTEILTVNAALGEPMEVEAGGVWVTRPDVPPPSACPQFRQPDLFSTSIFDHVEVRLAKGRTFEQISSGPGIPGDPDSALWVRVPGNLDPSAATLAIIGDYLSAAVSQPLGRRTTSRSLDNTIRIVRLEPTEWVLCDVRMVTLVDGFGQGTAYLWSESGSLLATASQTMTVRLWE